MIIHPSEQLAAHLAEQNVKEPVGGYEIFDAEYLMTKGQMRHAHPMDTPQELQDRVDYFLIWKHYGVQQNDGTKGAELQNAQKVGVLTEEFRRMNAEHMPRISEAVRASSVAVAEAVHKSKDEIILALQSLQSATQENLQLVSTNASSAANMRITHLDNLAKKAIKGFAWLVALLGCIFVTLIVLTVFSYRAHAQTGLDGVRVSASSVTQKQWMGGIAKIDFGSGLSVDCASTPGTCFVTATGGGLGGTTTIKVNAVNATTQDPINFQSGTNITVSNPSAGNIKFDLSGTFNAATASALAANPTDCSAGQYANAIAASGNLTCGQVAYSEISSPPTLAQTIAATASNWLRSYDATTGLYTKSRPVCGDLSDAGSLCTSSAALPVTKTAVAGQPLLSYDSATGAFTQGALTATNVGLGSVTNDAQTKAAIVPNTAPSAGQMLLGNAGGTAYAPVSMSQDCTVTSLGVVTCLKTNNVAFAGGATMSTTAGGDLSGTLPSPSLVSKYKIWTCETGLGDGLTAVTAGTYLQSFCFNTTSATVTLTAVKCYTDNAGSSTLNAAGNTLGALLTGAVTCSSTIASGTQSANVALTNGDFIKFTWVADGTSKQSTWVVTGTY